MKGAYFYDEEHYPNLASFSFEEYESGERHNFMAFWTPEGDSFTNIGEMMNFIHTKVRWLIGYNNKEYDDTILVALLSSKGIMLDADPKLVTKFTYELSTTIINGDKHDYIPYDEDDDDDEIEEQGGENRKVADIVRQLANHRIFHSLDLLLQFNRLDRVSLKQLAIGMKWHKIMDLPIPVGSMIKRSQLDMLMEYQWNDVAITKHALFTVLAEQVNNRIKLTQRTGLNLINACDSDMSKIIMSDRYCKAMGIDFETIKDKRTHRRTLNLVDCVSPRVHFSTKEFNRAYAKFVGTTIDPYAEKFKKPKDKFMFLVKSKYLEHTIRLGGIHSNNPAEEIDETESHFLIDLDVVSYYPRLLINGRYYPKHLGPQFVDVYERDIVNERLRAVKEKDTDLASMLKITANAIYGMTNSTKSWMYDPLVSNSICINGQLYLLMLVEWLENYSKCVVVYSNTDGLTVRVPKQELSIFHRICDNWCNKFNFSLKFSRYKKMVIRDVNNYLIFTDDPETPIKRKGSYDYKKKAAKGYKFPIVAKALNQYYEFGIPVAETITAEKDIYAFMRSEKTDLSKFMIRMDYMYKSDSDVLQKTNRWIVTKDNPNQGRISKVSYETKKANQLQKGKFVTVVNDVDDAVPFEDYRLDLDFYQDEATSAINLVSNRVVETHIPMYEQSKLNFG